MTYEYVYCKKAIKLENLVTLMRTKKIFMDYVCRVEILHAQIVLSFHTDLFSK